MAADLPRQWKGSDGDRLVAAKPVPKDYASGHRIDSQISPFGQMRLKLEPRCDAFAGICFETRLRQPQMTACRD
jgi:hypothetical protein